MTIQRNLNSWVNGDANREAVRRTIAEMDQRMARIEQMLTQALATAGNRNGSTGLTPQQQSDVAGLIGALSQGVIGQSTPDPVLPGQIGGGTVTSVTAGSGLSGGTINISGTIALIIGSANIIQKSDGAKLVNSLILDDGSVVAIGNKVISFDDVNNLIIVDITTFPTVDPGVPGALWNNANVINVSP